MMCNPAAGLNSIWHTIGTQAQKANGRSRNRNLNHPSKVRLDGWTVHGAGGRGRSAAGAPVRTGRRARPRAARPPPAQDAATGAHAAYGVVTVRAGGTGRRRWVGIRSRTCGWVMTARIASPHRGQRSGLTSKIRRSSCARRRRMSACVGGPTSAVTTDGCSWELAFAADAAGPASISAAVALGTWPWRGMRLTLLIRVIAQSTYPMIWQSWMVDSAGPDPEMDLAGARMAKHRAGAGAAVNDEETYVCA